MQIIINCLTFTYMYTPNEHLLKPNYTALIYILPQNRVPPDPILMFILHNVISIPDTSLYTRQKNKNTKCPCL